VRRAPDLISVVLPIRNGERHLAEQLAALASQTYARAWEVVVVDNGSTDRTAEIARSWASKLPALRMIDAGTRPGLNRARSVGAAAARGDFLAFCDADDVVDPGWLAELAGAAGTGAIVGGVCDHDHLNDGVWRDWVPPDRGEALPVKHGFLPAASGGNCGMWTSVAREVGWNEEFVYGSSDIEFSWRAQLAGYRLARAPRAVLHQRLRSNLRGLASQWYGYGRSGPQLYREFRSAGMARPDPRRALQTWGWLLRNLPRSFHDERFRGHWVRILARSFGSVVGSVRCGVLFLEAPARPKDRAA
jgi:glycosyltransferase involved in cell wall biosynthesis